MRIAFWGTGLMGAPMVERLLNAGYEVTAYNRTKAKAIKLENSGARVVDSPPESLADADVIIIMLSDYNAIKRVLPNSKETSYKGKTFIQMSTISPVESIELKNKIEKKDGAYIETPVLGSIPQIKEGSLFVLFGGTKEQFDKWSHLLKNFGKEVTHIGEVGDASATKLALNQLIASLTASFSMSLGYLRERNVNVDHFMNILRKSAIYAPTFDKKLSNMMNRDFNNPNFPLKHMLKDVDLIVNEFNSQKIKSDPLQGVRKVLDSAMSANLENLDYSAIYNAIHPKSKKGKD